MINSISSTGMTQTRYESQVSSFKGSGLGSSTPRCQSLRLHFCVLSSAGMLHSKRVHHPFMEFLFGRISMGSSANYIFWWWSCSDMVCSRMILMLLSSNRNEDMAHPQLGTYTVSAWHFSIRSATSCYAATSSNDPRPKRILTIPIHDYPTAATTTIYMNLPVSRLFV